MRALLVQPRHAHLRTEDLGKGFEARPVLSGVHLTASAGQRLGVIGENGRGKSTLLRLLAGALEPDTGSVTRHGSVAMAAQELPFADDDTVGTLLDRALASARAAVAEVDGAATALADAEPGADDRYAAALAEAERLEAWDAERRADLALAALAAPSDRALRLAGLSVGQRYRVRLACVLAERADILLLDEPTNHLDASGVDHLTARLREHQGVVVLVSHDRMLLDEVCTALLDLDPNAEGEVVLHGGGYSSYKSAKAAERARWEQRYALESSRDAELREEVSAAEARLVTSWRPPKGAGKHKRATRAPGRMRNAARRLEELTGRRVPKPPAPLRFASPELETGPEDEVLLSASGVAVPGRLRPHPDVAVTAGGRLVVSGANGAGKSTLLGVLAGRVVPASGVVSRGDRTRIGLLAQESDFPDPSLSPVRLAGGDPEPLRGLGLLPDVDLTRPVGRLSTGQRRRLSLALLLLRAPHVLLLDEPTNHLSIALVDELTEALLVTAAAVVVATHDRRLRADLDGWPTLELI
ncbi:ATP-binding cassette domain-containing protein [Umezawaea sp. Da 62-37]|uniref:ATP-binding cassette domain-containing protein n=1 Tax=Umezawaea sp. Da 62-37 TaxID=3075927 RepID=UPI0028F74969|nr:ATP-binding cassette domain-containing protein [Umezawaea sp. Da 62-37]WNV83418.1 ATP-binding cassette domain-containing protein [Umezawaea sp. Da 62-37]